MPEGDTIRRMAANIQERFAGQEITSSTFRHPRLATASLDGRRILSADARGKHLLVRLDSPDSGGELTLHAHMLMQGRVKYGRAYDVPEWRRRFEFELEEGYITGIDVPQVHLILTADEDQTIGHLGPDLCGVYDHELAVKRIASARAEPLGGAMLNQQVIAGFGNIYAVETPFICGISPFQTVDSIADINRVVAVGAALIRTNARRGPQNTTGRNMGSGEHWVLSGNRRRCLVCGSAITRLRGEQCPWQRRTAFCPNCQKGTAVDLDRVRRLIRTHPAKALLDLESGRLTEPTDRPVEVAGILRRGRT